MLSCNPTNADVYGFSMEVQVTRCGCHVVNSWRRYHEPKYCANDRTPPYREIIKALDCEAGLSPLAMALLFLLNRFFIYSQACYLNTKYTIRQLILTIFVSLTLFNNGMQINRMT